jgi:hypothetical protein
MAQAFRTRSGQRGISFLGLLFVGTIVACVMVVGAQIFPTVVEYQAVVKAVNKASAGSTVPEVRLIFEKAAAIGKKKTKKEEPEAVKPAAKKATTKKKK